MLRPKPDIDPGFEIHPPSGPGSGSNGGMMMSAGYNDPNFGLPSDSGGSFIGTGRCYAFCCIPPEIQPAIPPGGLFGPDTPLPGWGFPGFKPASDITAPQLPHILPATRPIEGPYSADGGNLPGTRPSLNLPGFGLTATSYDEFLTGVIFAKYGPPVRTIVLHSSRAKGGGVSSGDPFFDAVLNHDIVDAGGGQLGYSTKGENRARAEQSAIRRKHQRQKRINAGLSAEEKERQSQERAANNTVYEYYEGKWQEVPKGIDRGEYFDNQRREANREAAAWMALLIVGSALAIYAGATGLIGAGLRGIFGKAWYNRCLGIHKTKNAVSIWRGPWVKGQPRFDWGTRLPSNDSIWGPVRGKRIGHGHFGETIAERKIHFPWQKGSKELFKKWFRNLFK